MAILFKFIFDYAKANKIDVVKILFAAIGALSVVSQVTGKAAELLRGILPFAN